MRDYKSIKVFDVNVDVSCVLDFFSTQGGTIRTNCLDCLDRTNSVQAFFALEVGVSKSINSTSVVYKMALHFYFL